MNWVESFINAFDNITRTGESQWEARCPVHDDHKNSLCIGLVGKTNPALMVHCQACKADYKHIIHAVGKEPKDMYPPREKRTSAHSNGSQPSKAKIVSTYDYRDEAGTLLMQVCRMEPKDFRQRVPRPDGGGGWTWKTKGVRKVIYRLPELLAYKKQCQESSPPTIPQIFVVEGEKDVDRLRALGLCATTNIGGASKLTPSKNNSTAKPLSKWRVEYSEFFRDCEIIVIPDNDTPGHEHAECVAQTTHQFTQKIKIIRLAGLETKEDISDWLDARKDDTTAAITELANLISSTPYYEPPAAGSVADPNLTNVATDQFQPNEADDDPHRLAKLNLKQYEKTRPGATIRFWRDKFYKYTGTHYREIPISEFEAKLNAFIKKEFDKINIQNIREAEGDEIPTAHKVTKNLIHNVVDATKSITLISSLIELNSWINPHAENRSERAVKKNYISCQNGIINLELLRDNPEDIERCLLTHSPTWFSLTSLPFGLDRTAYCLKWLAFLDQLWPGDPAPVRLLQQWFGYIISGMTKFQKLLLMIGPTRGGKSTILKIMQLVVGEENSCTPSLASLGSEFGFAPFINKTLAAISDSRISSKVDTVAVVESLLKIVGEDSVDVNKKHSQVATNIKLLARLAISANETPKFIDASGALSARLLPLKFTKSFVGAENLDLVSQLTEELPGIFNWAIQGLIDLQREGRFSIPDSSKSIIEQFTEMASPISSFVDERCLIGPEFEANNGPLFKEWEDWCNNNGRLAGASSTFFRDLSSAFPQIVKRQRGASRGRGKFCQGIGLRSPQEPVQSDIPEEYFTQL